MREIKFRGMTISGDWVFGLLAYAKLPGEKKREWYISNSVGMPFAYKIRPETIGQYTGIKDNYGVEIYEDDIVKVYLEDGGADYLFLEAFEEDGKNYVIRQISIPETFQEGLSNNIEVIGNIHENPELAAGLEEERGNMFKKNVKCL